MIYTCYSTILFSELMGADIVSQSSEKEDMLFDTELPETITVNNVASECVVSIMSNILSNVSTYLQSRSIYLLLGIWAQKRLNDVTALCCP